MSAALLCLAKRIVASGVDGNGAIGQLARGAKQPILVPRRGVECGRTGRSSRFVRKSEAAARPIPQAPQVAVRAVLCDLIGNCLVAKGDAHNSRTSVALSSDV